jgi:hypothetical protein
MCLIEVGGHGQCDLCHIHVSSMLLEMCVDKHPKMAGSESSIRFCISI